MKNDPWTKAYESACTDTRLSDRDFRVYIAVRLRCGENGGCWEIVETIGTRAGGMSGRSVERSLKVLLKHGYLAEIPDPRRKTGRRLVLANPVVPPPTELSYHPRQFCHPI